jgi:hypothetical protein
MPANQPLSSRTRCQETQPTVRRRLRARRGGRHQPQYVHLFHPAPFLLTHLWWCIPASAHSANPRQAIRRPPVRRQPIYVRRPRAGVPRAWPAFTEDAYGFASSAEVGARQVRTASAIVRVGTGKGDCGEGGCGECACVCGYEPV